MTYLEELDILPWTNAVAIVLVRASLARPARS